MATIINSSLFLRNDVETRSDLNRFYLHIKCWFAFFACIALQVLLSLDRYEADELRKNSGIQGVSKYQEILIMSFPSSSP